MHCSPMCSLAICIAKGMQAQGLFGTLSWTKPDANDPLNVPLQQNCGHAVLKAL